ncbi:MAG: universal stress protein [Chamaesiphon sp.]|nr:universal stress protein [Chamaesiphon sp.]
MSSFSKILVAVDRSSASEDVFVKALELARSTQAKLVLLSAIVPDYGVSYLNPPIYPGGAAISITDVAIKTYLERQEQERIHSLEFLNGLATRANAVGVITEINQQLGDPARSICDVADTLSVDLIVVGRRGYSGLNELWMSSVSNYVLHHAPCSVLVIQPVATA